MERELEQKKKEHADFVANTEATVAAKETKKIVSEDELYYTKFEMRIGLLAAKLTAYRFLEQLFEGYSGTDRISVKELSKLLGRKPLSLPVSQALLLGRFVVEPRDRVEVQYDWYCERPWSECKQNLEGMLGVTYSFDSERLEALLRSAIDVARQVLTGAGVESETGRGTAREIPGALPREGSGQRKC